MKMTCMVSLCIAALITLADARQCLEAAAAAIACNGNKGRALGSVDGPVHEEVHSKTAVSPSACILAHNPSCKAALKALYAKENDPACSLTVKSVKQGMTQCDAIINQCPELGRLGPCIKAAQSHHADICGLFKGPNCDALVKALVAKKNTAGCMSFALEKEKMMNYCEPAASQCPEEAAAAIACTGNKGRALGSVDGPVHVSQEVHLKTEVSPSACILAQNPSCKAALKALYAKKNDPACRDSAKSAKQGMKQCNTIISQCPELKRLGPCIKAAQSHHADACALVKGPNCAASVNALVAKKNTAGCKSFALQLEDNVKQCSHRDCSFHGTMTTVKKKHRYHSYCVCDSGWGGETCASIASLPCNGHGSMEAVGKGRHKMIFCACDPGWTGEACESEVVVVHGRHLRKA